MPIFNALPNEEKKVETQSPAVAPETASSGTTGVPGTPTAPGAAATPASPAVDNISDPARVAEINRMYDANINAQRANLEGSLNQNVSNLEANREKINQQYQQRRNASAAEYERMRRNFNEQAMMNGLATGVGSQAALAQNAAQQRAQGSLLASQASDLSAVDRSIADLQAQYQMDINAAVAQNDYQRAAALLDEYNVAYSRAMDTAQQRAQFGDFSGYAQIYGQEAADTMAQAWAVQNPQVAWAMGSIDAETYRKVTGKYPPEYKTGGGSRRRYSSGTTTSDEDEPPLPPGDTFVGGGGKSGGGFGSNNGGGNIYDPIITGPLNSSSSGNGLIASSDRNTGGATASTGRSGGLVSSSDRNTTPSSPTASPRSGGLLPWSDRNN